MNTMQWENVMKPIRRFVIITASMILMACATVTSSTSTATPTKQPTQINSPAPTIPQATPTISQNSISPALVAEWNVDSITDMVWSPNSSMFVVDSFPFDIQAFDVKSLKKIWSTKDNYSYSIVFNPNGTQIVEPEMESGVVNIRNIEDGNVVRQIKSDNCGGGQVILPNPDGNTYLVAFNDTTGLNSNYPFSIRLWDLDIGICKNLIDTHGYLSLFDVNTAGNLIAIGTILPDEHFVIWDVDKQDEICRTHLKGYFGRFVPNQNILAITSNQKIIFIDASTCQEL
jgi:WD40 repeat protein